MDLIANFEKLLASGTDNAMLRFSLGNAYYQAGEYEAAIAHLKRALEHNPGYSAAWKMYGKSLADSGHPEEARKAYAEGIEHAENKGDIQAAKEMRVFLRRLEKAQGQE